MYYINNKLFIDKIAVDSIIKKTGTPTYCYSYKKLRDNIKDLKKILIGLTANLFFS